MAYECRHSADFDVSPERLFDVMTDVERRTAWVPMLIGVQVVDAVPFGPGSSWYETYKTLGADDAVDNTVRLEAVTVDRPRRYVVRQLSPPGAQRPSSAAWDFNLTPLTSGTRLDVRLTLDYGGSGFTGWLARLLARGTGPFAARQLREELQALQRLLDVPR